MGKIIAYNFLMRSYCKSAEVIEFEENSAIQKKERKFIH